MSFPWIWETFFQAIPCPAPLWNRIGLSFWAYLLPSFFLLITSSAFL